MEINGKIPEKKTENYHGRIFERISRFISEGNSVEITEVGFSEKKIL